MKNELIMSAVETLRDVIYTEIRKDLLNSPDREVGINVELPGDIDEDRYHTTTITSVYLDDEENVMVIAHDDLYDEESEDDLSLYSVDEMLKIVEQL